MTIQGIKFYSLEETAKMLGITKRTLYNWTSEAEPNGPKHLPSLRAVVAPNGKKIFKEADILAAVSHCLEIDIRPESLNDLQNLAQV